MLGGRRAVRINGVTDGQAKLVEDFLDSHRDSKNTLVIFEAGELPGRAALRKLFEGAPHAAAIACYHDSGGDLKAVIQAQLNAAGKGASQAALSYLEQSLGGDRGATRSEIEKLVLYVGEQRQVELEDVLASVGHSATILSTIGLELFLRCTVALPRFTTWPHFMPSNSRSPRWASNTIIIHIRRCCCS
jgi:DNA polymerase-3 subunit delta